MARPSRTEYHRAWRAANPEKVRAARQRHRAGQDVEKRREQVARYNADRVEYKRQWSEDNAERIQARARARRIEAKYGLTSEAWNDLFESQDRRCALCKTHKPGGAGWATDHDHQTGQVRGILCNPCNLAIGLMADDPERLRAAADYLEEPS